MWWLGKNVESNEKKESVFSKAIRGAMLVQMTWHRAKDADLLFVVMEG